MVTIESIMTKSKSTRSGASYGQVGTGTPPEEDLAQVEPVGAALDGSGSDSPPYATPGFNNPSLQAGIDANAADIRALQQRLDQLIDSQPQSEQRICDSIISYIQQCGFQPAAQAPESSPESLPKQESPSAEEAKKPSAPVDTPPAGSEVPTQMGSTPSMPAQDSSAPELDGVTRELKQIRTDNAVEKQDCWTEKMANSTQLHKLFAYVLNLHQSLKDAGFPDGQEPPFSRFAERSAKNLANSWRHYRALEGEVDIFTTGWKPEGIIKWWVRNVYAMDDSLIIRILKDLPMLDRRKWYNQAEPERHLNDWEQMVR